ncbi:hypothetical protein [Tistlia consotensis]|uniref:hypothetical protein n=1 Tax=Tistlia consotensis TaxID=1321365 RepID=UPI00117F4982|nr:hypothetical protein [Tistlia consotensis]
MKILHSVPAARRKAFFSPQQCRSMVARLTQLRALWSRDYDGEQYSFPDNFYARANGRGQKAYFSNRAEANARMSEHFPGERQQLLAYLTNLLPGRHVRVRPGWLGPAFVIFPAGELLSHEPGPVHIDLEGLTGLDLKAREASFFSVICMIQPAQEGGGVRLWNRRFGGTREQEDEFLDAARRAPNEAVEVNYDVGDFLAINSLSPHQILKFGGGRDRITLNAFAVADATSCDVWF